MANYTWSGSYVFGGGSGGGGGATNLTEFTSQTPHTVFYANNLGDVTELALGADGTFLKSNGASAAPTFATPSGSGDVLKVGTPVNNQVGVWTGDGTIEGDANLTFDTATDTLTSVNINATTFTGALTGTASGNEVPLTFGDGLTRTGNDVDLDTTITGLVSVTSTTFIGALTGTASGNLTSANIVATITNGDTTHASSSDALFDALALKEPLKGADDNFVTDAQLIVIGNTSGTNTGDNATNSQYSGLAALIPDNLTDFTSQTAHTIFYANNLGDVTELALGADGTFLKSNGATSAPSFATPAGSGDVSKVGTPVNNQVGVWTGDGTIEGDANLTFDTATDTLTSVNINATTFTGALTGTASGNLVSGGALGTPSSGTLTNATGLPIAGLVSSTSTAIGVGSIELGHATDSTITRVSAGIAAIEGNNIITANIVASATVQGVVELAITSEIDTGTDTTRAIPVDQFVASKRNVRHVVFKVIESATDVSTGTTLGGDLELPIDGTIVSIGAFNDTAGTTGTAIYDVNLNGSTIMTTNKVQIETTEKSSRNATTQPTLTTTTVAVGDILTFDCDTAQTTKAKGLTFRIGIRE